MGCGRPNLPCGYVQQCKTKMVLPTLSLHHAPLTALCVLWFTKTEPWGPTEQESDEEILVRWNCFIGINSNIWVYRIGTYFRLISCVGVFAISLCKAQVICQIVQNWFINDLLRFSVFLSARTKLRKNNGDLLNVKDAFIAQAFCNPAKHFWGSLQVCRI